MGESINTDMIIFDYMWRDTVSAHIEINTKTKEVVCIEYTDIFYRKFLHKQPHTIEYVNKMLAYRCFSPDRPDRDELLEYLGLTQYNPIDIVRKTHGHMASDDIWIRFVGENLTWEDVNVYRRFKNGKQQ